MGAVFLEAPETKQTTIEPRILMFKRITIIVLLTAFISVEVSAQHRNRDGGALLGGLAGAAIGAAIGDKGNNETEGALIGGALGAIAGGSMGNQKDQQILHNRRYHSYRRRQMQRQTQPPTRYTPQQQYHQPYYRPQSIRQTPVYAPSEPGQKNLSPQDVLNMVRAGWQESMIIQQVRVRGMQQPLTVTDVIHLHKLGIRESILVAMQESAPVVVEQTTSATPEQLPLPAPPTNSSSQSKSAPYGTSVLSQRGN
jgi:uncharacterized protein YcfJ